jgi:hypothetical protein
LTTPLDTPQHKLLLSMEVLTNFLLCSVHQQHSSPGVSLIDGVANGSLSGSDVNVLEYTCITSDVTGITVNTLHHIPICMVAG